jgi:molybdate transport system ATP-binding protein
VSLRARALASVGRLTIDVELDTGPGTLAIIGPNGAGKSSLLSLLLGALPMTEGVIEVDGRLLYDHAARLDLPVEQRRLGYVPQDYALFPHLSVRQNIEFALLSALPRNARAQAQLRVDQLLRDLELEPHAQRSSQMLSGGEKQRVALARALAVDPRALLFDEPLAALDVHARREVRAFLAQTLRELELPTIIVTHDPVDARVLGQRIAVLEAGRITQLGTWAELSARPATRFVEEFVAPASDPKSRGR